MQGKLSRPTMRVRLHERRPRPRHISCDRTMGSSVSRAARLLVWNPRLRPYLPPCGRDSFFQAAGNTGIRGLGRDGLCWWNGRRAGRSRRDVLIQWLAVVVLHVQANAVGEDAARDAVKAAGLTGDEAPWLNSMPDSLSWHSGKSSRQPALRNRRTSSW